MFLGGLLLAGLSIYASLFHLKQTWGSYWDFVAFVMVIGGTLAVFVITTPWALTADLKHRFKDVLFPRRNPRKAFLMKCLTAIDELNQGRTPEITNSKAKHLGEQTLQDGIELIKLGFTTEELESVLKERVFHAVERTKKVAASIRGLSKYPPAFGLAGTVLGLIHLMRGVSDGIDSKETGLRMAVALLATFYGLLVSNLFLNPMGENIQNIGETDEKLAEIALQAILLSSDHTSLLKSQELLNSFVSTADRVDMMSSLGAAS